MPTITFPAIKTYPKSVATTYSNSPFDVIRALYAEVLKHGRKIVYKHISDGQYNFWAYEERPFLWFFKKKLVIAQYIITPVYTQINWRDMEALPRVK